MSVADSLLCEKGGRCRIRVRERPTPSVDYRGRACRAEAMIVQVLGIVYRAISTFLPRSACRLEGERRVRIAWPRSQRSGGVPHVSPQRCGIRIGRTTRRLTWLRRYPCAFQVRLELFDDEVGGAIHLRHQGFRETAGGALRQGRRGESAPGGDVRTWVRHREEPERCWRPPFVRGQGVGLRMRTGSGEAMENSVPSGVGHRLAVTCLQGRLTADVGELVFQMLGGRLPLLQTPEKLPGRHRLPARDDLARLHILWRVHGRFAGRLQRLRQQGRGVREIGRHRAMPPRIRARKM